MAMRPCVYRIDLMLWFELACRKAEALYNYNWIPANQRRWNPVTWHVFPRNGNMRSNGHRFFVSVSKTFPPKLSSAEAMLCVHRLLGYFVIFHDEHISPPFYLKSAISSHPFNLNFPRQGHFFMFDVKAFIFHFLVHPVQSIQIRLNDPFSIQSYLIKPMQRMVKYRQFLEVKQ